MEVKELSLKDIQGIPQSINFFNDLFTRGGLGKQKAALLVPVISRFFSTGEGSTEEFQGVAHALKSPGVVTTLKKANGNIPSALKNIGGIKSLVIIFETATAQQQIRDILATSPDAIKKREAAEALSRNEEESQRMALEKQQAEELKQAQEAERKRKNTLIESFLKPFGIERSKLLGVYDTKHPDKYIINKKSNTDEILQVYEENDILFIDIGTGENPRKYRILREGRVEELSIGIWKFVRTLHKK